MKESFFEEKKINLSFLKKYAIILAGQYSDENPLRIEIHVNPKTKHCSINIQECNL